MMDFHEWWIAEFGHAPNTETERSAFALCMTAWRVALTHGNRTVAPEGVESALNRVGEGKTTYEDELTLRQRIQVGDLTIRLLAADLDDYEKLAGEQQEEQDKNVLKYIPEGAEPIGGKRWRCPRCNFIGGLRKTETVCRGCNYPDEDTRDWVKPVLEAVPDGPDNEDAES